MPLMEKIAYMNARINKLKSEIYILLVDDLFLEYAEAEKIIEDNFLIIAGNRNHDTIKKINDRFSQIKQLQAMLGV